MSEALAQVRLGAALRALPSELRSATRRRARGGEHSDETLARAADLERVAPGLALLLQLRDRVFVDALACARRRAFQRFVLAGYPPDGAAWRRFTGVGDVIQIDDPAVVGANGARSRTARQVIATTDVAGAIGGLRASDEGLAHVPTFFVVQGLSLRGDVEAWSRLLAAFAADAGPGSELLVNLLDDDTAGHAAAALATVRDDGGALMPAVRFGRARAAIARDVAAHGLALLGIFDARQAERAYLGVADLLLNELYVWIAVGPHAGIVPPVQATATLDDLTAVTVSRRLDVRSRPRLRRDVAIVTDAAGATTLVRPLTRLRAITATLTAAETIAATRFDGTPRLDDVATELRTTGAVDAAAVVAGLASRLHARGFLQSRRGADLGRRVADAVRAIGDGDAARARRVRMRLAHHAGNAAVDHLRAVLARCARGERPRVAQCGPITALCAGSVGESRVTSLAADAADLLTRVTRLLEIECAAAVMLDATSERDAIPVTMVVDADPHTVVRIPAGRCTRAVLAHELTHVVAACASPWLSEGLAVWVQRRVAAGRCFPDDADELPRPSSTPAIARIGGEPSPIGSPLRARLTAPRSSLDRAAYRAAGAFVDALVHAFGTTGLLAFVAAFAVRVDERGCDAACAALGVTSLDELEVHHDCA